MIDAFDAWWDAEVRNGPHNSDNPDDLARSAWDHQQKTIDELRERVATLERERENTNRLWSEVRAEGESRVRALEEALEGLVRAWDRYGPNLVTLSGEPTPLDHARAVLGREK